MHSFVLASASRMSVVIFFSMPFLPIQVCLRSSEIHTFWAQKKDMTKNHASVLLPERFTSSVQVFPALQSTVGNRSFYLRVSSPSVITCMMLSQSPLYVNTLTRFAQFRPIEKSFRPIIVFNKYACLMQNLT